MSKKQLTDRQFAKELELLREQIQASTKPLPEAYRAERVRSAAKDPMFFAQTYFPHYLKSPCSALHVYFADRYAEMILLAEQLFKDNLKTTAQPATNAGLKEATAAPRGGAKSTWTTLILPLWAAAYKYRKFPLIVSETATQAEDFLSFIKLELEVNERLLQDFPDLCGVGPVWRANCIITRNGVKFRSAGAGQKLRGMRHGSQRPDLVVVDDLEDDEAVLSSDQRQKLSKWFFRALMKIGQPDTVFIVIGTILHAESLLVDLLNKPGWRGRKFQAVIRWAQNNKLWEMWENIFRDATVSKEEAEFNADAFYAQHEAAMLIGAEVLWPEREPYYYLMKMRLSEGEANFASEKQNEPVNKDDCLFDVEDVQTWDEDDFRPAGEPFLGTLDPSLGKKAKRSDPSAILGGWWHNGRLYIEIADEEKRKPSKMIDDVFDYHVRENFQLFGVESVQFQEYFAEVLEAKAKERGKSLTVECMNHHTDKHMRIQRLQPWIKNGWIRFRKHHRAMLMQIAQYPLSAHDDLLDALEMLVTLCERLIVTTDYKGLFA